MIILSVPWCDGRVVLVATPQHQRSTVQITMAPNFIQENLQSAFIRLVSSAYVPTWTSTWQISNTRVELFYTEVYEMGPSIRFYKVEYYRLF